MKIVKWKLSLLTMFLMLSTITFAKETKTVFKATVSNGDVTVEKTNDLNATRAEKHEKISPISTANLLDLM